MSDAICRRDENTVTRTGRLIGKADDSLRDITPILHRYYTDRAVTKRAVKQTRDH